MIQKIQRTEKVQQILKSYRGEGAGVLSQLARLLYHGSLGGTGKLVILPVDQGFEHGPVASFAPNPEGYDPSYHFRLAIEAGCNAYAAPLGALEACAHEFAGEIPLILKINHSDLLYKGGAPLPSLISSVEDALRLGCSAIGFTIYPGSSQRKQMYEEIRQASAQAKSAGLAVVIWSYPRGEGIKKEDETALDVVAYSAHIAAQLGAHIIKVKPPTNQVALETSRKAYESHYENQMEGQKPKEGQGPFVALHQRVRHIVESCFNGRRMVIFSGGASKEKEAFLKEIKELAKGGAFGSIIGRNAFQRPKQEALQLLKEVMEIYREQVQVSSTKA